MICNNYWQFFKVYLIIFVTEYIVNNFIFSNKLCTKYFSDILSYIHTGIGYYNLTLFTTSHIRVNDTLQMFKSKYRKFCRCLTPFTNLVKRNSLNKNIHAAFISASIENPEDMPWWDFST